MSGKIELEPKCSFCGSPMNWGAAGHWTCTTPEKHVNAEYTAERFPAEPPAAVQAGDVREGLSAEMKEFRDLFFGSEASFRNGYMCGMSDAVIVERGLKPPGEDKLWGVFSQSLKSWAPNPESIPQAQPPALTALVEAAREASSWLETVGQPECQRAGGHPAYRAWMDSGWPRNYSLWAAQQVEKKLRAALTPFLDPAQPKTLEEG